MTNMTENDELDDVHSAKYSHRITHDGSFFEKVTEKVEDTVYHALFRKEGEPETLLVVKAFTAGAGLGKGGRKWTYTTQVVDMKYMF